MKNKISNDRLSYFPAARNHGNVRAWVKPVSASQINKRSVESNLRWEDDGGPAPETGNSLPQEVERNTTRQIHAAE